MPAYAGITGSVSNGCMQTVYFTRSDIFEYGPDSQDALKYALCSLDPAKKVPRKCSPKISPRKTRYGAKLSIREIADQYRIRPDGHMFCRKPLKMKCFGPDGKETYEGITCSRQRGFRCRGRKCKNYKISVCCPKSENNCALFPKACAPTQQCKSMYYGHECSCKQGYELDGKNECVDLSSQCKCGCTGDPHCRMCNNYFFDFMGRCRYIVITNHCANKLRVYPSVHVITKHRKCGRESKKVSCTQNLEVRICENKEKKKSGDCIIAKLGKWNRKLVCSTRYPKMANGKRWMANSVETWFSGRSLCNFKGFGLRLQIQGSKWNSVIDKQYKNKMCGLCGTWNDKDSGLRSMGGELFHFKTRKRRRRVGLDKKTVTVKQINRKDSTVFGDTWLYNVKDVEKCVDPAPIGKECTKAEKDKARKKCKFLEVVAKKFNEVDYLASMADCIEDECSEVKNAVCLVIEGYVERKVKEQGLQVIPQWRNDPGSPCKIKCRAHEKNSGGKIRQVYCDGSEKEVEDCVCETGYKFDPHVRKCVEEKQCYCKMTTTGTWVRPGMNIFDSTDCSKKSICSKGLLKATNDDSGMDPHATCNTTGPTGCVKGFEGNGYTCKVSSSSCKAGWMKTPDRCIKLEPKPAEFALAAETCRQENADLVSVAKDADLNKIKDIIKKNGKPNKEYYIAGVCGSKMRPDTEKVQDGKVKGADSYIRPKGFKPCTAGNDPVCFVAELKGNAVMITKSNCVTKRHFICEKKPDDEYKYTPDCKTSKPAKGDSVSLNPQAMKAQRCITCEKPRAIKCRNKDSSELDDASVCNVADFFMSTTCLDAAGCDYYRISLQCPILINECAKKIDFCNKNEKCVDKEFGYDCECETKMDGRVIINNKEVCTRLSVCKMSHVSGQALKLYQFGKDAKIYFNRPCAFKMISTKCNKANSKATPLEIDYTNRGTSSILTFEGKNGKIEIHSNGLMTTNGDSGLTVRPGDNRWSVKTSDNHLECLVKVNGRHFTKIDCFASNRYDSACGVCVHDGSDISTAKKVREFFDKNKIGSTSCNPPTVIDEETKTAPTLPPTKPRDCNQPKCDGILDAFGDNCPGATEFFGDCVARLCAFTPVCEYVTDMLKKLDEQFSTNRNDNSICTGGLAAVREAVNAMRDSTGCKKKCSKKNTELSYNAPSSPPTCQNDVSTNDGREVSVDSDCVCMNGFILSGINDVGGMQCISLEDCGCFVDGKPVEQGQYGKIDKATCQKSMLCKKRNELDPAVVKCDDNANCVNGKCKCKDGFAGEDGYTCTKVDVSNPQIYCYQKLDTDSEKMEKSCLCRMGYASICSECIDIDECDLDKNICGENSVCTNTQGSFNCACKPGFKKAGKSCVDIKECKSNPCDKNSKCFEQIGSYTCVCCAGYVATGKNTCALANGITTKPNKCCVCSDVSRCYNTNSGKKDVICYTDEKNVETQYDDYKSLYIHRCLNNRAVINDNVKYEECPNPLTVVTRPTTIALPVETKTKTTTTTTTTPRETTTTTTPPNNPCGDVVCDMNTNPNDKQSGAVCQIELQKNYENICELKKDECRNNGNSPPPTYSAYVKSKCEVTTTTTTTTTPTEKKPEFSFTQWTPWTVCSAIGCGMDNGTQTRTRQFVDTFGNGNTPPIESTLNTRSCQKSGCPKPTETTTTTSKPNDVTNTPEPQKTCSLIMCAGQDEPVCARLGNGKFFVYSSKCHLRQLMCMASKEVLLTIDKTKCGAATENQESPRPCSSGPIMTEIRPISVEMPGGVRCHYIPKRMLSCEKNFCTLTGKETPSSYCCVSGTFTGEKVVIEGGCSDGSSASYVVDVPLTCECKDAKN